ncbi:MAG: hypothetical protein LN415_09130 [Candidatus Thermoplasmatota archaeon]|nr:hypothetical protein [Candidatus Thermoplasmatota archaeon]
MEARRGRRRAIIFKKPQSLACILFHVFYSTQVTGGWVRTSRTCPRDNQGLPTPSAPELARQVHASVAFTEFRESLEQRLKYCVDDYVYRQ